MRFFVLNTVEEFVSNVRFIRAEDIPEAKGDKDSQSNNSNSTSVTAEEGDGGSTPFGSDVVKAVNFSYVRDPAILGPGYRLCCWMEAETEADRGKFIGFLSFLQNRQKSAVIRLETAAGQTKDVVYAFHPDVGVSATRLRCFVKAPAPAPHAISSTQTASSSSLPPPQLQGAKAAQSVPKSKPPPPAATDFLGSLLGKVESKAAIRAVGSCVNPAARLAKELEDLEAGTRSRLAAFVAQTDQTSLELEPMEKNLRFVVHEVVESFPGLVSASIGDDEERHVVIYKKGHEPPDVELHGVRHDGMVYPPTSVIHAHQPSSSSSSRQQQPSGPAAVPNLIKIEAVKRDRRSIEEIQRDMKRRKEEVPSAETNDGTN